MTRFVSSRCEWNGSWGTDIYEDDISNTTVGLLRCRDIQHNDTLYNGTQHCDTQHYGIQHCDTA
jgi:hypothetical protein